MSTTAPRTTAARATAADIQAALMARYPAASHALMFEVAPRTGGGTRYADAVAVGLWASHGHKVEGFEVKVSRADFLKEMAQPEKSAPVYRYCNHWWLVTPKGLVEPSELPPTWGLMELVGETLRVRVKAPALEPERITLGFFAALCRRGAPAVNDLVVKILSKERQALTKEITERLERQFTDRVKLRERRVEDGMKVLEAIKAETGINLADESWRRPDWLAAVKLVAQLGLGSTYSELEQLRNSMRKLVSDIDASGLLVAPEGSDDHG